MVATDWCIILARARQDREKKASFYGDTVVFASHAEGRGFDLQPGQMVFRIFSPVTFILALN